LTNFERRVAIWFEVKGVWMVIWIRTEVKERKLKKPYFECGVEWVLPANPPVDPFGMASFDSEDGGTGSDITLFFA